MKKIISLFLLCATVCPAYARTVDVSASYAGAKHFEQVQASATMALALHTLAGLELKWNNERIFKDPVYSVAVPVSWENDMLRLVVRPFYYVKNDSHNAAFQDSSALGINGQMRVSLNDNTVDNNYTYAFLGASFGQQKGTVFYNDGVMKNRSYAQAAYSLGLSQTLYNTFGFDLEGTAFVYPNGINRVVGLRSVMDQQELARTQTLDIVHDLAKYTLGARMTRIFTEKGATIYLSYRYGEYHTTKPEHSVMLGNSFTLADRLSVDLAYNHVRDVHNHNHRDIVYLQLSTSF